MGRRINDKFIKAYQELDKLCCDKFGITTSGVTEYINRLNNARFAPDRDQVLPKLVRYRNIRNLFAHEPGAVKKSDELGKEDVKWITRFKRDVQKRRDPISKYLRKARRFARNRKIRRIIITALIVLAVLAVAVGVILLLLK